MNGVKHCVRLACSRVLILLGVRIQDDKSHWNSVQRGEVEVVNYSSGLPARILSKLQPKL